MYLKWLSLMIVRVYTSGKLVSTCYRLRRCCRSHECSISAASMVR